MASPPATKGLYSPLVRLSSALAPRPSTTFVSLASSALETVRSAVTTTLLVVGSVAQAVPGMVASALRVVRALFSSAREFSTMRALAPAASTVSAAASSSTFTTRSLLFAS